MTLTHILVFTLYAFVVGALFPPRWRLWLFLGGSVLVVYWLQPSTPIRNLDFWFPTASIVLTIFVWVIVSKGMLGDDGKISRAPLITGAVILGLILLVGLTRYASPVCCLTPTRPPPLGNVLILLGLVVVCILIVYRDWPNKRMLSYLAILIILGLLIILKSQDLSTAASKWLRTQSGQSPELALALDLPWLGFSYLAFRLLGALRDYQAGRLPDYSLRGFATYAIFFPTFTAGPIDRSQRFMGDLDKIEKEPEDAARSIGSISIYVQPDQFYNGSRRVLLGVFKKFVLADGLALIALNARSAAQVDSTLWMWVLLYAFALRIYLDFSGYTDIALGLGLFMGFKLPENFDRPYLKSSLTAFWNSWHITLAQWFRSYYFNPLTRSIRRTRLPGWIVILAGQLTTMLLIGLWHGISWNFAIWGMWHGVGLFVNNRWSAWAGPRIAGFNPGPGARRTLTFFGWLLTFNYVALGWVWFALPEVDLTMDVFQRLFGI